VPKHDDMKAYGGGGEAPLDQLRFQNAARSNP